LLKVYKCKKNYNLKEDSALASALIDAYGFFIDLFSIEVLQTLALLNLSQTMLNDHMNIQREF
jgi:hypothetical protein